MKKAQASHNLSDKTTTLEELKTMVERFTTQREWQQFHDAKNLSMAISAEAAELMELLRWTPSNKVRETVEQNREEISYELVDTIWVCLCFANRYNIDVSSTLEKKMALTAQRYPVDQARGRSDKYTAYTTPAQEKNER